MLYGLLQVAFHPQLNGHSSFMGVSSENRHLYTSFMVAYMGIATHTKFWKLYATLFIHGDEGYGIF